MNRGQLPTNQLHDINWGALDHTSRAPRFMPCNYYLCVRMHVCGHIYMCVYMQMCQMNVCITYSILDFNFIEDEQTLGYWLWFAFIFNL